MTNLLAALFIGGTLFVVIMVVVVAAVDPYIDDLPKYAARLVWLLALIWAVLHVLQVWRF